MPSYCIDPSSGKLEEFLRRPYQEQLKELSRLYTAFASKFGRPLSGDYRHVFFDTECVWKIPAYFYPNSTSLLAMSLSEIKENCQANLLEAEAYLNGLMPVAKCKLFYVQSGVPIIRMERLVPLSNEDVLPDWNTDQVGKNKHGEIVIFDAHLRPEIS